jgi:pimeloyl-ACP methyl ester carboxylesterase
MTDPTVVFVHGAFADASGFRGLYDELLGEDVTIIAPPNPLRGLSGGDGEYLKGVIDEINGPVLLVAHSYGGSVITAAGTADNVVGLVYISGFAPEPTWPAVTSSAKRVLPTPLVPTSVTTRSAPSTVATSISSRSRPTNLVASAGRLCELSVCTADVRGAGNDAAPRPSTTAQNSCTGSGKLLSSWTPTNSVGTASPISSRAAAVSNN